MSSSDSPRPGGEKVSVRPLSSAEKPVRRTFPGPRGAQVALRVAINRSAHADLVAHARESLEAEVCGVLVGQIGEDDEGVFVHVEAVIRGNAATQGATHVTFTQATWDAIHQSLERDHPKRRIVGWYHTHPGFGVEFSEMDVFIQRNFFSGPTQIALVTDPTDGAVALAITTPSGIEYLPRYWIEGREQTARVPASAGGAEAGAAGPAAAGDLAKAVKALETRVGQLIQSQDDQRTLFHQVMLTAGLVLCLAIIGTAGYFIYSMYSSRYEPPSLNSFVPVPVKIGDKTVMIGVGVVQWDVPPELNAAFVELEQRKRDEAAKAAAAGTAGTDGTASQSAPTETEKPDDRK